MTFIQLTKEPEITEANGGKMWIRPMLLGSGWAAVHMWINNDPEDINDVGGVFPEPYNTGIGRYATKEEAVEEVKQWAEAEELPYYIGGN